MYEDIGKTIRADAGGVKQAAFVGVIHPLSPEIETPEQVCDALVEVARYIPKDQLGATDNSDFNPFSIDVKP